MVEGKVFIISMRESTVRGVWKSSGQREEVVHWTWPADRPGRERRERRREGEGKIKRMRAKETKREGTRDEDKREHMAKMAELHGNGKLGKGSPGDREV